MHQNTEMAAPVSSKVDPRNYAWGVGGVADNLLTFGLAWTIIPVFNIGYGVNAYWLGVFIFVPRMIDVLTDPIMGVISDRTRSRFGRRRPYIFLGAIAMAALFAILWMPPFGSVKSEAAGASVGTFGIPPLPSGKELYLLIWVGVVYTLLTFAYTVFSVPYIALGFEFTRNYDEMTKVMASRLYFTTLAGFGVTWIYSLAVHDRFGGDETVGMRYVGVLVAIAILLTGIVPAVFCREQQVVRRAQNRVRLGEILAATLGNRAFVSVMAAMIIFVIAIYTAGTMGAHINIFYVARGDKQLGAWLGAVSGNIMLVCNLIGMYLMMRLSRRFSKKSVIIACFLAIFIGNAGYLVTWNPDTPKLQFINAVIIGFGSSGIWLMLDSMMGDVTKDDHARSGVAREGLFGASKSFMFKIAVAVTSITGAMVLNASGYDPDVVPDERVQRNLKLLYIALQCGGCAMALLLILLFPITRQRAAENERVIASFSDSRDR